MTIVGVDTGSRSLREADHLIHDLVDRLRLPVVACTHLIRGARPHVAVSLEFDGPWSELVDFTAGVAVGADRSGPPDLSAAAVEALAQHRVSGRAVVFPGSGGLTGGVRVGDVLARSPITRFQVIGGPDQPGPDDVLDTRDHLRPEWQAGELVLAVTPAGPGRYAPFEVPNPTPCCADHD
ncbi:hypothetical protein [Kutzneria sp. CA-103260]|uniref:hypothetical protein n=1 Tax=Kutzneria sp. CA-103260 TaxID=2802641 RepID=UPI001BA6E96D|nr:hypothetical protein [Kutzneria sp. CA-103260]QUQ65735.1 hypothetical protein JJ691_34590 [Kutzneria sp. CA-103260]